MQLKCIFICTHICQIRDVCQKLILWNDNYEWNSLQLTIDTHTLNYARQVTHVQCHEVVKGDQVKVINETIYFCSESNKWKNILRSESNKWTKIYRAALLNIDWTICQGEISGLGKDKLDNQKSCTLHIE